MAPAPNQAETVIERCAALPVATRDKLAFKWIDRCVRVHAAIGLERIGYASEAERLGGHAQLRDRNDCRAVVPLLRTIEATVTGRKPYRVRTSDEELKLFACLHGLIVTIDTHLRDEGIDIHGVVNGVVTSARCAGVWDAEQALLADVSSESN
jgi:hypothetical protein